MLKFLLCRVQRRIHGTPSHVAVDPIACRFEDAAPADRFQVRRSRKAHGPEGASRLQVSWPCSIQTGPRTMASTAMTRCGRPGSDPAYAFVTSGIADAVSQARIAAGEKDVGITGSAGVRQALQEGLLDELIVHLVPVLLGGGVRLPDGVEADLRCTRVVDAPGVTHLAYDVVR